MILIERLTPKKRLLGFDTEGNLVARECSKCGDYLSICNFTRHAGTNLGFNPKCKDCYNKAREYTEDYKASQKIKAKERYQKNKDRIKEKVKEYRTLNREVVLEKKRIYGKEVIKQAWWKEKYVEKRKEQTKKWRQENPEHIKEYNKKYKKENKDICERIRNSRVARKRTVTPKWLTYEQKNEINEYYKIIRELNKLAGYRAYHVDHVVPLQGTDVCGLHVPWNLQILSASENASKKTKFDGTNENESWRKDL